MSQATGGADILLVELAEVILPIVTAKAPEGRKPPETILTDDL